MNETDEREYIQILDSAGLNKSRRKGHFRTLKTGQRVWVKESETKVTARDGKKRSMTVRGGHINAVERYLEGAGAQLGEKDKKYIRQHPEDFSESQKKLDEWVKEDKKVRRVRYPGLKGTHPVSNVRVSSDKHAGAVKRYIKDVEIPRSRKKRSTTVKKLDEARHKAQETPYAKRKIRKLAEFKKAPKQLKAVYHAGVEFVRHHGDHPEDEYTVVMKDGYVYGMGANPLKSGGHNQYDGSEYAGNMGAGSTWAHRRDRVQYKNLPAKVKEAIHGRTKAIAGNTPDRFR